MNNYDHSECYMVKFSSGETIVCQVRQDDLPILQEILSTGIYPNRAIRTINNLRLFSYEDETGTLLYSFSPWLPLQYEIDREMALQLSNVVGFYAMDSIGEMKYHEMVEQIMEMNQEIVERVTSENLDGEPSPVSPTGKIVSIFDKSTVTPDPSNES